MAPNRLTCGNCNCFRKENPEPVKYKYEEPIYIGICLCHGYHLKSNEEICVDFER